MLDPEIRLKPLKSDKVFDIYKHRDRIMKLRQEQVCKLREGKATLVADHSKPDMMDKVLKEAFPKDRDDANRHKGFKYFYRDSEFNTDWMIDNHYTIDELIPLDDFFEKEETGVEEIEFKSYKPKTAEERDEIVKNLQAMDFKEELPSELNHYLESISKQEHTLIALVRMRDVYRDGLKPYECEVQIGYGVLFSLQDKETAELFLSNFKEELEQVKHLIS